MKISIFWGFGVLGIDEDELPEWTPKFDPLAFQKRHQDVKIEDWQFSQEEFE